MKAWKRASIGLLTLVLSGACITVSGGESDRSMHTYVFEPEVGNLAPGGTGAGVLLVGPPSASPGYDSRFMVYTEQPSELAQYAYSQWADSPTRMLEPLLLRTLTDSGRFAAVVDISTGVLAELRLDTEVITLRHEIMSPDSSRVRFVVRGQMVEMRTRSVIATRVFEVVVPAPTHDAPGAVIATNQALSEILRQVCDFASQAAASRPSPPPRP